MRNLPTKLLALLILAGLTSFGIPTASNSLSLNGSKNKITHGRIFIEYAPTFSNCPSNIKNVMPNLGDCTAVVTWAPPAATGSGTVTITSNYSPGDSFYPGTHRVIYRATDSSGDTSFCTFTVEVLDNQAPTITVPAGITRTADAGSCGAVVTFPYPTANDNCPAGEGAPIDQNFDNGDDLSTHCYDFDGTFVGNGGNINGSAGELETVELINNDIRSFTSPMTKFNGTGEIFFDHRIIAGSLSGNIGANARITVKMITPGGVETIIFNELYLDDKVQTEYIDVPQVGNYYVQFEFETDQNRNDIAYLDNLYIPGYVISDESTVACNAAVHRVVQIAGQPFRSGIEFPVGTTRLEYLTRDAAGNVGFNSFKVTVTNNINPPAGNDVNYCEGSPIPFLTVSVGTGETVDWYDAAVGGTLLFANNASYQPPGPGNYYAETRNITTGCVSGTRRRIRLTEDPQPSAPVSPSPIEYCLGDTSTQLTVTGDPGNMILWYDAASGGTMYPNAPTPDTSTAQTTFYYVEQVDATTGCISDRTEVVVTVYALPLAPRVITPVEYCVGEMSDELNSSVTSGTSLRWYDAASGGNEIPGTTRPNTTGAGQQFFWVTQSATSGSANCESTRTQLTVNVNSPPAITMQPVNRSVCENGKAIFAVGASDADTFQWQLFDGSNWNDVTNTAPYSGVASNTLNITNATSALNGNQYRAVASSPAASCADAVSNSAILTVNTAPITPMSGGDLTECEQDPIQTLTATANPPSGASIVWYDAASGGNIVVNPILDTVGTVTYYAQSNDSGNSCRSVGRTPVTLTIQPAPTEPTNGGDQTECEESPVQTLTATATAPSGATVVWYDAASGGNSVANPTLNSVGSITYYAQSNDNGTACPSTSRAAVNLSIRPAPTPPVSGGDQTECEASPAQTLTATATVSSGLSLTWYDAASGGNMVGNPTLSSVGTVTYYAQSTNDGNSCESTSRTPVTLTIGAVPAAPTSGGNQTECEASPTQTITATATAPAGATVVWYDAASGGNTVGSPTLNSVGTITYYAESQTTGNGCVSDSRTPVTLTMNARPTIAVTPASQACSPDLSTYSVSVDVNRGIVTSSEGTVTDNGGNKWSVSGVNSGNNITVTVTDANSCTENIAINAPNCACPTVNTPTSGGDRTECETDPIQTLTATATPPSGASVVWYDAATNGNVVASPTWSTVGAVTYYAESVDNVNSCTSASRTSVTLTIQGAPLAPTSGGDQTDCEATPTQTITATATSAAGTNIVWYDAASGGNTVANPTLNSIGTITYYAESRDNGTNCISHSRTSVTLTIQPNPTAPTSGGDQTECETIPIQTLTATATAPSGSSVVWYDAASGGNTVTGPTLNTVGTITYYAESQNSTTSCASTTRTPVKLTIQDTPTITQTSSSTSCSSDLMTYSVSVDVSNGAVSSTEGTVTDNGSNNWTITGITSGNDITVTVTATNSCSDAISITAPDCSCSVVNAPTSGGDQTECEENPIQTLTATATPPTDATVVWFDAASGGNTVGSPTLSTVGTVTYFAESRQNVTNCTSSTRTPVSLTIQTTPADPVSGGNQNECDADPTQTLTATATAPPGSNIVWFDAASGGTVVTDPNLDTVGTVTYYAESGNSSTSCTSFNRTAVTLTIRALPIVVANATTTLINAGEPVTLTGSGANGYVWDNGVNDGDTVFPLATTTYTVIGMDANGCENTDSVTVTVGATSDIRLEKAVDTAAPNVGDTVTFTLTVTNDGPSDDAGGSIVGDALPIGYMYVADTGNPANGTYDTVSGNWTLPALNNGGTVSIDISTLVIAPTGTPNEYNNVAQVTSATNFDDDSTPNNDDGDQSEDDEAAVSITPQVVDLEVTNSISQATANPGNTLTLSVDVINKGPNDATNVCIENIVPDGFTVTSITKGGSQTGSTILWSGIDIPNGATTNLTFEVTVNIPANTPDEYLNTAQVTAMDQFDSDSAPNNDDGDQSEDDEDNAEIVLIPADLSLSKATGASSELNPNAGDTVTFELVLTNDGPGIATNVSIEDIVPIGYTLGTIDDGGTVNGNTITWLIANMAIGTHLVRYEATLNAPTDTVGEYTNTAQVTASDQFDPDSVPDNDDGDQSEDDEANYTINVPTVDIDISKTVDKTQTFHGDTIVFTVTTTNNGAYAATNIGIEDVLPSGYTLVSHTADLGAYNETMATWEIPLIAIGETATLKMTVTVTETEDYTNIAELIYVDQIDPNIANDRAEATPEITQDECLTVFNEFSPNDDGANDVFFIECIEQYPNSLLQIYNRWGNEVFAAKGYDNSWGGTSVNRSTIGASEKLPVGTYYYILEPGDGNAQAKSGWLYISR